MTISHTLTQVLFKRGETNHPEQPSAELLRSDYIPPPTLRQLTKEYAEELFARTGFRRLDPTEGWQTRILDGLDKNALLPLTLREGSIYRITAGIVMPHFTKPNHFNSILLSVHGPRAGLGLHRPTLCFSRPGTTEERLRSLVCAEDIFVNIDDPLRAFDYTQTSRLIVGRDLYNGPSSITGDPTCLFDTDHVSRSQFEIYTTPHPRCIFIRSTSNKGTTIQPID